MGRSHGFAWTEERRARVRALRASGMMYYQIAKQLSEEWSEALTESQCSSVLTGKRKAPPAQPQATTPTMRFHAPQATAAQTSTSWMPDVQAPQGRESEGRAEGERPPTASVGRAPAVCVGKFDHYLIISDIQIPYGHPEALAFCKQVRREYSVPLENMLCVGDEVDQLWASKYPKGPDVPHTPNQEIKESRKELMRWYEAFPDLRICDSNHGGRWAKAAERGGIPAQMMRDYREVLQAPAGWRWADHWIIRGAKQHFRIEHGHKAPKGHTGLRTRPLWRGIAVAFGHEHKEPATLHIDTDDGRELWSMRVGALMDRRPTAANAYCAEQAGKPALSVGVVLNGGRTPLIERM